MIDIMSRGMAATAIHNVEILTNYVTTQLVKIDLIRIVTELPETGEENKIYLVPKSVGESSEQDYYDEFIWVNKGTDIEPNYQWEFVASRPYNIDLDAYATKEYVEEQISANDIVRHEYEITTTSAEYEIDGEVINVELTDTVTNEIILGKTNITILDGKSNVKISFTTEPINPIKVLIFFSK